VERIQYIKRHTKFELMSMTSIPGITFLILFKNFGRRKLRK